MNAPEEASTLGAWLRALHEWAVALDRYRFERQLLVRRRLLVAVMVLAFGGLGLFFAACIRAGRIPV